MAEPLPTTGVSGGTGVSEGGLDFASVVPMVLEKFVQVLEGAAIIAAGFFFIRYMRARLRKIEISHEPQRNAINLFEKITTGFVVVVSITLALKIIGIDMTLLVSVAILGLSYGLQDVIKNYVAGILILFKAPFKIGETVQIRGYTGKIFKMDFQSTTLETFDRRYITIYNSDVMTQSIVNYSNNTIRRLEINVTLGYGSDIKNALAIFHKILANYSAVLKTPKPAILFKKFTQTGVTFMLRFWVQRPCNILKIRSEIGLQISQAFDEQQIFMPYGKGIEVEDEIGLSKVSEMHKKRSSEFYALPMFAQAVEAPAPQAVEGQPPVEGQAVAEGQPGVEVQMPPLEDIDSEEPEA